AGSEAILTPDALELLASLHRQFDGRRRELLAARAARRRRIAAGERPDFRADTAAVRADESWQVASIPADLSDRRVEITGPVDGAPISGSLFDFGLYFFHNAKELVARGSGPYFYLPKMESHLEARLWNDVFIAAQEHVGVPVGTIRATVLIETILAAFEMDEI